MGAIINEVCDAIHDEMGSECIPVQNNEKWVAVSNNFLNKWNFPNCLGPIDGKHVSIHCPPNAGSLFYNYKVYSNTKYFILKMTVFVKHL